MADFRLNCASQSIHIATNGGRIVVNGQEIDVSHDKRKRRSESPTFTVATSTSTSTNGCTLFIGNLAPTTTEQDLRRLFSGYHFNAVRIPVESRSNRDRGCGFVDMRDSQQAQNAIKSLSGVTLFGRKVSVMIARQQTKSATAKEEPNEEPPEKKLKRGSDYERDLKNHTPAGSKYEEHAVFSSPQRLELSVLSTDPNSSELLALDFAQLWVKEYAGPESGQKQRTECLAGLLLQLDVSNSKLHEHISRTLKAQAASQEEKKMVCVSTRRPCTSNGLVAKLEQDRRKALQGDIHAEAPPPLGRHDTPIHPSSLQARNKPQKRRRFGSPTWTNGKIYENEMTQTDRKRE